MEIHENTKKTLNFVYDSWVFDEPTHNLSEILGDSSFREEYGYFDFYQRFFHAQLGYPRNIFEVQKHRISDVYDNPSTQFYYGIKTNWGLGDILGNDENNYQLSDSIIECLQECDNIKIFFIREHEPESITDIKRGLKYLSEKNISDTKLLIISNNPKIEQYKKELNANFDFFRTNLLQITCSSVWNELGSEYKVEKDGKFFSCLNKSPKQHRISTLIELQDRKILQNTNWSMLIDYREGKNVNEDIIYDFKFYINDVDVKKDVIHSIIDRGPRKSDYEKNLNLDGWGFERPDEEIGGAGGEAGGIMVPESKLGHENSYVNIVTESYYDKKFDVIHVTEKSLRPFFYYQFPIIVASEGHIKWMEDVLGFDFYRDIIDHSYNDIENDKERFQATMNEIERINNNQELFKSYFKDNKERFEKNKNIVSNLPNNDQDLKYFINKL